MSYLAADMASSGQCDFVLEIPWNSRAVRFGGCIHERLKGLHCAWVPACAWGLRTDSSGYAEGGWRVVTSMRSVADLLVSRSCNETHWHRSVEGMFPPGASLSHLCRRLMPIVLRRPAPMELAELVAGATIKRRLRSKQSIQRRRTKKQPLSGNSLPHVKSISPIQENSMQYGYDGNDNNNMSDETKCETNYSINNKWNNTRNKHLTKHDTNDDVDLDNCVVHTVR